VNCSKVEHVLSAYIDCELPGTEMLMVRHHLAGCSACQEQLAGLKAIKNCLASKTVPEPPIGYEDRLSKAVMLETNSLRPHIQTPVGAFLLTFAGVMSVVIVVGLTFNSGYSPVRAQPLKPSFNSPLQSSSASPIIMQSTTTAAYEPTSISDDDRAFYEGSDPLRGPATAVAYARR